jgi:hypothetical protein
MVSYVLVRFMVDQVNIVDACFGMVNNQKQVAFRLS